MPPFAGAAEWLNSEPLGPAELRGHVVLVNFWTLTCINWLRQEPYVRAWSQAYRDDGLARHRGPHAGVLLRTRDRPRPARRSRSERSTTRSRSTTTTRSGARSTTTTGRRSTSSTRKASSATSTSAKDATSNPSASSSGCSACSANSSPSKGAVSRRQPTGTTSRRPRHISGTGAASASRQPTVPRSSTPTPTSYQSSCASTTGRSPATGRSGARTSSLTRLAAASPSGSTRATRISCYLAASASEPIPFRVLLDGEAPGPSAGVDVDEDGNGVLSGRPPVPARTPA